MRKIERVYLGTQEVDMAQPIILEAKGMNICTSVQGLLKELYDLQVKNEMLTDCLEECGMAECSRCGNVYSREELQRVDGELLCAECEELENE